MRKTETILLLTIAAALCTASCREKVIEIDSLEKEIFLMESDEGIYRNGEPLFLFRDDRHQKALNPDRIQYRIQTDEQDTCLNVTMEALPGSAGVHITTSIDYRSPGDPISSMSHLECSRMADGRIWLWSPESLTGIIMDISGLQ
ncbi:MAG TPA: hypothetical protein IAC03_03210 [Candidatus Coprenecus pullistercoris]|nr:hypothetical protein [Candidatus Coprenecus pullistercoris]